MELYKQNLGGATNYNIFVPENVSKDADVIFYAMNLGFTDKMKEDIIAQNGDAIIIVPENTPVSVGTELSGHNYQTEAIEMFRYVKDKYNLETTNFTQAGYSAGYGCSIRTMADYIKTNPDADRQVLISVDGCESNSPGGFPIYKSEYEALKNNNTIIISYSQQYRQAHEIGFLKDSGLPILFVVDPDIPKDSQNSWAHYHNVIPNNFTNRGLFDQLNNFALGKAELPEGYTYQVYNPITNRIEDIDPKNVSSFFGIDPLGSMLGQLGSLNTINLVNLSVTSDNRVLGSHVNNIISNIKNSSFVQNGVSNSSGFVSTTKVPSLIPEMVKQFYTTNATLLLKIANEVTEITKIGESIEKIDKETSKEADDLGASVVPIVTPLNNVTVNTEPEVKEETPIVVPQKELPVENVVKPEDTNKKDDIKKDDVKVEEDKKVEQPQPEIPKKEENNGLGDNTGNVIPDDKKINTDTTFTDSDTSEKYVDNELEKFYDFNELYSDDKKIVYDYNNEYRIVVHKNGDDIIGIEHYYKFDNNVEADKALEMLTVRYADDNNVLNIVQKDNYVKVLFKDEMFSNLTVNDIRNKYRNLSEIKRL